MPASIRREHAAKGGPLPAVVPPGRWRGAAPRSLRFLRAGRQPGRGRAREAAGGGGGARCGPRAPGPRRGPGERRRSSGAPPAGRRRRPPGSGWRRGGAPRRRPEAA
ncbi:MAG TPA: hypothetical protein DD490_16515 [Acidobacteria bacterium]|nr:hypothetical protein [Acidobacteriota bacterium]